MLVTLLYFGVLKDHLCTASETIEIEPGATVLTLLRILRSRASNEGMQDVLWDRLAVAVNRQYSSVDAVLEAGNEVALLPPVSGGNIA